MQDNLFTGSAFYKALTEDKLMGTRCKNCGSVNLPPRPICPNCLKDEMEWVELNGQGRLLTYSFIYTVSSALGVEGYGRNNPFCAGIVQLEGGLSISAQILGIDPGQTEKLAVGMPATAVYVHVGKGEGQKTRLGFRVGT